MSGGWDRIGRELDQWARERRVAQFWWRDDDAQDTSPELDAMLKVARRFDVAIGLSVVPAKLKPRLAKHLAREVHAQILVHGFAHENRAREGHAKREFSSARPLSEMTGDLARGMAILREAFGKKLLPVVVPPWNRIAPAVVAELPRLGYRGLSTWKPRARANPVPGLAQVNTHLDVIDWRRGRVIKDEGLIAGLLLRKLRWRREHRARASEPLGLLTHHAHWSSEKERIIVRLLETTRNHPAAEWLTPQAVFAR
ncbi:MAG: polysaccharide deacetylase [Alphaproteobacteria bacterium]|nr:polysaccharide deacetylase [Alphaproteobacteria bacterium]